MSIKLMKGVEYCEVKIFWLFLEVDLFHFKYYPNKEWRIK